MHLTVRGQRGNANAHKKDGKADGVRAPLEAAPNAQDDTAQQHTNSKSNFCGRSMGWCSSKIGHTDKWIK